MDVFWAVFFFVVGAAIGSFLNVCIWRLPQEKSIVFPASHCPQCGHPIRPVDNIPVLSYLILRGKCRDCGGKISAQYPVVEAITAVLSLVLYLKYGLSWQYPAAFAFTCALIVVTFIDLEHQIIPDVITLPGIPIGLFLGVFIMGVPLLDAVLGIAIGGGFLYFVAVAYQFLTKREGMGGGDIKLLAMMGAFLGWKSLFFIVFISSLIGALVGVAVLMAQRKGFRAAIPYGPFLSAAAVGYLFWGELFMTFLLAGSATP
jgi:leader peptidase (prepilin peptidase)/N-methyltransferase